MKCNKCGYESDNTRASLRREMVTCDVCDNTYCEECAEKHPSPIAHCENCDRQICEDCLAKMATDQLLVNGRDVPGIIQACGVDGFMTTCETSDEYLCPECFEE